MKNFAEMANREFAFACLNALKREGRLTEAALALLTDTAQCRERFRCGFAILLEVPGGCGENELRTLCHISGKRRYYQERFCVNGRTFVITNHWYGPHRSMPDNRTPFMEWVLMQAKENTQSV